MTLEDKRAKVDETHTEMQQLISDMQDAIGNYTDAEIALHVALNKEIGEQ